jgi:cell division protein FtsQ
VFAITHVELTSMDGAPLRHVNAPSVRANALGKLAGNFFTLDLNTARQAFESVPWVRHASVRREWPNGWRCRWKSTRPSVPGVVRIVAG